MGLFEVTSVAIGISVRVRHCPVSALAGIARQPQEALPYRHAADLERAVAPDAAVP